MVNQIVQALVAFIGYEVNRILVNLGIIQGQVQNVAQEHTAYALEQVVNGTRQYIGSPITGLPYIIELLTNIGTALVAMEGNITGAIAALPAGSSLPTSGAIASDVWGQTDLTSQPPYLTYGQEQAQSHQWAAMMWLAGSLPARKAPFFNISPPPPGIDSRPTDGTWPEPDWDDIRPSDELMDWLQRTAPDFSWSMDGGNGYVIGYLSSLPESEAPHYTARLTPPEWKRQFGSRSSIPPVWPGLAGVTLGTPVAISPRFTITEPMHGVIVAITAVAPKQMYYTYDDLRAYRHIGALAFLDDNGDAEGWQSLGFVSAVYCCRSMSVAAAVKIMSANGTVGTVTPWLRSS